VLKKFSFRELLRLLSPLSFFPTVKRRREMDKKIVFVVAAKPPPQKQFFSFIPLPVGAHTLTFSAAAEGGRREAQMIRR
jgi:hypothetical protein